MMPRSKLQSAAPQRRIGPALVLERAGRRPAAGRDRVAGEQGASTASRGDYLGGPATTAQILHRSPDSQQPGLYLLEGPQGDRWIALAPFCLELFEPKERSTGPRTLRWRRRNTVH